MHMCRVCRRFWHPDNFSTAISKHVLHLELCPFKLELRNGEAANMNATCTSHAHHMHITCTSHAYHMHITCTSHAHHMHITCTSHAHHMHITCTSHVHVCDLDTLCEPHNNRMTEPVHVCTLYRTCTVCDFAAE